MPTTKHWAESLSVSTAANLDPIADYTDPYFRSAHEIAIRAIILHGVTAVAYGVGAQPITAWFKEQNIWEDVKPCEREFILSTENSESDQMRFRWKQESEWTLFWMLGKVTSLALPTHFCDSRLLADEIMPQLGDDLKEFVEKAALRSPGALLAEDDRTYDLWCNALALKKRGESLPSDLKFGVLYERRYAFEWISGDEAWDEITCDA